VSFYSGKQAFQQAGISILIFNEFQVDVAWGCSRHHEDDEATADGRNDLQELDERPHEDVGLQGAFLRPLHQAQWDQVSIL